MRSFYVYQSVFLAQISVWIGSSTVTWSSPMLVRLNDTDDNPLGRIITDTENSVLSSIFILGALVGAVVYGILVSKLGRRTLLLIIAFPSLIFYLVMAWAKVIWLFYISRFATGTTLGAALTILPIYSAELASASNRGILSAAMAVFINIGMLMGYGIGPFVSFFWFQIILAIPPAIYIVLIYFFASESTYHLIQTDPAKAEAVLKKLRGEDDVTKELDEIKCAIHEKDEGNFMDIVKNKDLRRTFLICLIGLTFQQFTGTGIVATYNQSIFQDAGGDLAPEIGPIIVGVVQLITTVVTSIIADRFPRKVLLIVSHLGVALAQIPFGVYFYLKDHNNDVSKISWLPLVCLMSIVIFYNVGVGPILYTLIGELFPEEVKGVAVSWLVVYNWSASFVLTLLFNSLKKSLGMSVLFWIFAGCSIVAIIFHKIFMIETKGKTLQQIQEEIRR